MSQPARPLADPPDPLAAAAAAADVEVRALATMTEYHACVTLQHEIWGTAFTDVVPASLLQIATHVGGIALGAFATDGRLIGFVFGLTGVHGDEIVHWSHMLGVHASAREHGIGRRLKEAQRAELARRGIAHTYWTFDPLQAKNAHLNINRLGVDVVQYVVDMYGPMGSPLHYDLPTDRLVVRCANLREPQVPRARAPHAAETDRTNERIEIPLDLQEVIATSPAAAFEWRASARRHFQWALSHGYAVTGFRRDDEAKRCFYLLGKPVADLHASPIA